MHTRNDVRVVSLDLGGDQQPIPQPYGRVGTWRPRHVEVRISNITAELVYVEVRGPVVNADGSDHATRVTDWSWQTGSGWDWPPVDTPAAALAAVDNACGEQPPAAEPTPAYAWGRLLAVYGQTAAIAGTGAYDEWSVLCAIAFSRTTVRPRLVESMARWMRHAEAGADRTALRELAALRQRAAELDEQAAELQSAFLPLGQQQEIIIGYHLEHADLSRAWTYR